MIAIALFISTIIQLASSQLGDPIPPCARTIYGQCANQYQNQTNPQVCNNNIYTCTIAGVLPVCDPFSITILTNFFEQICPNITIISSLLTVSTTSTSQAPSSSSSSPLASTTATANISSSSNPTTTTKSLVVSTTPAVQFQGTATATRFNILAIALAFVALLG